MCGVSGEALGRRGGDGGAVEGLDQRGAERVHLGDPFVAPQIVTAADPLAEAGERPERPGRRRATGQQPERCRGAEREERRPDVGEPATLDDANERDDAGPRVTHLRARTMGAAVHVESTAPALGDEASVAADEHPAFEHGEAESERRELEGLFFDLTLDILRVDLGELVEHRLRLVHEPAVLRLVDGSVGGPSGGDRRGKAPSRRRQRGDEGDPPEQ